MKCENCGSEMKLQEGIVYTSNPVRYGYKCPNCGNVQYSMIKEENNQKDYEKKYKDALANARQEYTTTENVERKQWLEELFPELQESEDERIRKEISGFLKTNNAWNKEWIDWLEKQGKPQDKGEISDGYHTFNELYYYRMLYNAAFFNMLPKEWVHKSKRHNDGEECFGGGWFIVMANLPTGQISNHYELKDWDLFQIPEKEVADKWDGHTPQEAADRLHKYLLEKQSEQKPFDHEHATITQKDDERIRKELINVFSNRGKYLIDQSFGDITVSEALAWLKKQGEQKPIISVAYMVSKYASTPEQGNKGFGKPINCMVRAYRQGILDTLKKIKENNVVEEQQNTNEQNTQKFGPEDKSLSDKHQWEDGDIIRLKNDDGVRWQIFKSPESEINEEWFMSQIMENGIAGGYVSSFILDANYEFLYNPHKEFLKKH